jgi:hypothetical protein
VFPASSATTAASRYEGVMALYNFGGWSLDAGYTRFDPAGPDSASSGVTRGLWASASVTFGLSEVRLNVGRIRTSLVPSAARSTVLGLNYSYLLSKRTNLYRQQQPDGAGRAGGRNAFDPGRERPRLGSRGLHGRRSPHVLTAKPGDRIDACAGRPRAGPRVPCLRRVDRCMLRSFASAVVGW